MDRAASAIPKVDVGLLSPSVFATVVIEELAGLRGSRSVDQTSQLRTMSAMCH